jgi:5'-AMP-activated protein kinase regulatory beta subunit
MKKNKQGNNLKSVELSCVAPNAQEVSVGGTFNDWNPARAPMSRSRDGTWHITLKLAPGAYEYKFLVDGKWCCKPDVDESDARLSDSTNFVRNPLGTMNCRLQV